MDSDKATVEDRVVIAYETMLSRAKSRRDKLPTIKDELSRSLMEWTAQSYEDAANALRIEMIGTDLHRRLREVKRG
ncbi:unnamed protein product [marine sediment metagenome]|uniref:Uncharacterized protein n=1 Tax=marine sediment metagenome TaxID=412755 RepID=X0SKA5_9ZZZZ